MPTQDVIVLAGNPVPSKPGALSQSPTFKRARPGRATTASALAAAPDPLCPCHVPDHAGEVGRTIAFGSREPDLTALSSGWSTRPGVACCPPNSFWTFAHCSITSRPGLLRSSREKIFRPPPIEWIKDRPSHAGARATDRKISSDAARPPRPHPSRARHARHRRPPSTSPPRLSTHSPSQKNRPPLVRRAVQEVETAGIEPASAVAQKVASTSVAGALISPSTRHAGGVVGGQLRRCPRRGWSGPHRVSLLDNPAARRRLSEAGLALAVS
jgi:hypothetical protein